MGTSSCKYNNLTLVHGCTTLSTTLVMLSLLLDTMLCQLPKDVLLPPNAELLPPKLEKLLPLLPWVSKTLTSGMTSNMVLRHSETMLYTELNNALEMLTAELPLPKLENLLLKCGPSKTSTSGITSNMVLSKLETMLYTELNNAPEMLIQSYRCPSWRSCRKKMGPPKPQLLGFLQ